MRDFLSEMAVTGTFACCLKILTCVLPLGTLEPELVLFSLVAVFPKLPYPSCLCVIRMSAGKLVSTLYGSDLLVAFESCSQENNITYFEKQT